MEATRPTKYRRVTGLCSGTGYSAGLVTDLQKNLAEWLIGSHDRV